jgi:hypothetical protein
MYIFGKVAIANPTYPTAISASNLKRALKIEDPDQELIELDFSDRGDPTDGSGIGGPACYVRAVQAGMLPDTRETYK